MYYDIVLILFSLTKHDVVQESGLIALGSLPRLALQSLTTLSVTMWQGPCYRSREQILGRGMNLRYKPGQCCCYRGGSLETAQRDWTNAIERLARHVPPGQLTIEYECDTVDPETAQLVLEPLLKPPKLTDCAITLGPNGRHAEDPHMSADVQRYLGRLVRETVKRTTSTRTQPQHNLLFRFLDLPKELRILILELAGLICSQPIDWGLDSFRVFSREDFLSDCQSHFMDYDPKRLCNLRPLTSSTMCQ